MKEKIGLNSTQLEEFFAQIKMSEQSCDFPAQMLKSRIEEQIYCAYRPIVPSYAKHYSLREDEAQGIFDEVFTFVYNNFIDEIIEAKDFNHCIKNIMSTKCQAMHNGITRRTLPQTIDAQELTKHSRMYTMSVIVELNKYPTLAKELNITTSNIKLLNDFYGLNAEATRYTAEEIADKYGLSPVSVRGRLASCLKKIRNMQAFRAVKAQNPNFNFGS